MGRMAFTHLAVNMPLTTVWPVPDIYNGIGQSEALSHMRVNNDIELKSYLEKLRSMNAEYAERITPLIDERNKGIKAGQPIKNILSDMFALKESQRRVRHMIKTATKAKAAIDLKPCIIDHVVNYDIRRIESQWKENLMANDDLAAPIFLVKE